MNEKPDVIIFEDYDKGVITPGLIREITDQAAAKNIPVAVDPKQRNFNDYRAITLFKPNLKELREGLKLGLVPNHKEELERAVSAMITERRFQMVMVTLSESGIFVCFRNGDGTIQSEIIPAHIRNIADVSGAGDTVISVAALGLAIGLKPAQTASLANLAGGLVCEELGVVPVNKLKLLNEALIHLTASRSL